MTETVLQIDQSARVDVGPSDAAKIIAEYLNKNHLPDGFAEFQLDDQDSGYFQFIAKKHR